MYSGKPFNIVFHSETLVLNTHSFKVVCVTSNDTDWDAWIIGNNCTRWFL